MIDNYSRSPRCAGGEMTFVPNETEQALNRQHDIYAAAREEYRKKIAEQAAEIERLRGKTQYWPDNAERDAVIKYCKEENERLRAALKTISDITDYGTETTTGRMTNAIHNVNVIARSALETPTASAAEDTP